MRPLVGHQSLFALDGFGAEPADELALLVDTLVHDVTSVVGRLISTDVALLRSVFGMSSRFVPAKVCSVCKHHTAFFANSFIFSPLMNLKY